MAKVMTMQGRCILVVEENYWIAQDVAEALLDAGADVLGPVSCVGDALRVIATESQIDGALLDVNVRQEAIWPVVDVLLERGVPIVLVTGYSARAIPHAYAHLSRYEKPMISWDLANALASQLPTQSDGPRSTSAVSDN